MTVIWSCTLSVYGCGLYCDISKYLLEQGYSTYVALNYVTIIQTEIPSKDIREFCRLSTSRQFYFVFVYKHITRNIADNVLLYNYRTL